MYHSCCLVLGARLTFVVESYAVQLRARYAAVMSKEAVWVWEEMKKPLPCEYLCYTIKSMRSAV